MKPKIPKPEGTVRQTARSSGDHQEQVRRRAYELYEQRGREDGRDLEDWLRAESEVTNGKTRTVAV